MSKHRLALFASGTGSNVAQIVTYFQNHTSIEVGLIVASKSTAGVLNIAQAQGIDSIVLQRTEFYENESILLDLKERHINFIVLAGFLWLVPGYLVKAYKNRMVNIHPALLPKFGGKGMYGMHVHRAVIAAGETESGPTVHLVNEVYDDGAILFQERCPVLPDDQPEDLARRVLALEHRHFAPTIERYLLSLGQS